MPEDSRRFDAFCAAMHAYWHGQMLQYTAEFAVGKLSAEPAIPLFPAILLCIDCGEHYVAELIGAGREFSGLLLRKHAAVSVDRYFYQFDNDATKPIFTALRGATNFAFLGLTLAHTADVDDLKKRYGPLRAFDDTARIETPTGSEGALLCFEPESDSIFFEDCLLVNRYRSAVRLKRLQSVGVFSRTRTADECVASLREYQEKSGYLFGIGQAKSDDAERRIVASGIISAFLSDVRETTVGDVLRTHPEVVRAAFDATEFVYEPYLEWQPGTARYDDTAINPDLMVRRRDGYYDIVDLKLALRQKTKLTTGEWKRRRLVADVTEGIAQLAHYKQYFDHPENREHAQRKYGIRVANPRLILVVGNQENVDPGKFDEALRAHPGFEVIDWDTIVQLYLDKSPAGGILPDGE